MKVLIIGSGGREHALAWSIKNNSGSNEIYALPGNYGIEELGTLLSGDPSDPALVLTAVRELNIDLVVVGPEVPLVNGLSDALITAGVRVFGPTAAAAAIEGSKVFSKKLMADYNIPTASFEIATDLELARSLMKRVSYPHVFKTDGLAAGKGALIIQNEQEASEAIDALMVTRQFGEAGDRVIFEEFMTGEEVSVFAVASGERYTILPPSQDYKRVLEGDQGLNTGGMGAYGPVEIWNAELEERVRTEVIEPTLRAMVREGRPYSGLLYAGLMVKDNKPKVVEFNCRFGDPETQAVVPILDCDLLELMWEAADPAGKSPLPGAGASGKSAVCVVVASEGYPGKAKTGFPIHGISEADEIEDALVFQAGTGYEGGVLINRGGRVLNVVGIGSSLPAAREKAYTAAETVGFQGAFFRRDIAWRGMETIRQRAGSSGQ